MNTHTTESATAVTYKCMKCGLESNIKEAFIIKKSLFRAQKAICFECEHKKMIKGQILQLAIFLGAAVWFSLVARDSWFSWLLWLILAGILIQIPFTILHGAAYQVCVHLCLSVDKLFLRTPRKIARECNNVK